MEQIHTIKDGKKGKLPKDFVQELPEISKLVKSMLAENPDERPKIEEIHKYLQLPVEIYTDFSGSVSLRRENSSSWRKK